MYEQSREFQSSWGQPPVKTMTAEDPIFYVQASAVPLEWSTTLCTEFLMIPLKLRSDRTALSPTLKGQGCIPVVHFITPV